MYIHWCRERREWRCGLGSTGCWKLAKCQKHGVTIEEIQHVLDHTPFLVPDYEHSRDEDRIIAVGLNASGRPVFIVFTLRMVGEVEIVRPIGARYMHRKEIEKYEHLWRSQGTEDDH